MEKYWHVLNIGLQNTLVYRMKKSFNECNIHDYEIRSKAKNG